jgi:broad specificity phosphatase PhoE
VVIGGRDAKAAASQVMREHDGGTVLFVGSSGTVPQLVHELSGLEVGPATENEHDTLYVVSIPTFGRAGVLRLRY